jgi:hypothetical protein
MAFEDHDRAVERLTWALRDLPLTDHQRRIFKWLTNWEPETMDAISQALDMARSADKTLL